MECTRLSDSKTNALLMSYDTRWVASVYLTADVKKLQWRLINHKFMDGKTFHITKKKLEELKKEHKHLISLEQTQTVGVEAPKMMESDDMNPEFVSYQEDMDSLRRRIDELEDIIKHHQVIKVPAKERAALVDLGATVHLDMGGGKTDQFRIVGTLESNPTAGFISNESPMGKALLGKAIGQEVSIDPAKKKSYKIKHIHYEEI